MKNIIKNIFGFALVIGLSVASIAFAERTTPSFFNLTPTNVITPADPSYVIGDSSNKVQNGYFANLTVDTCTGCGGGGASIGEAWTIANNIYSQSSLTPTTTQNIIVNGIGTSTFVGGIEAWRQISAPYFHATSTTGISTINNRILVGQTALSATAPNSKAIFSQGQTLAIGSGYSSNISVYTEAISNGSTLGIGILGVASTTSSTDSGTSYGGYFLAQATKTAGSNVALRGTASSGTYQNVGVYGVSTAMNGQSFFAIGTQGLATTNGNGSAAGIYGTAQVTATGDTGGAYGGYFASSNTHAGGTNYGIYSTASGGSLNYSFFGAAGSLTNTGMITSGTGVQSPYFQGSGSGMTLYPNSTTQANALIVYGNDGVSSFVERMRMLNTGNLGIGTTSPWAKLSIVDNTTNIPKFVIATSTGATPLFFIGASSTPIGNGVRVGIGTDRFDTSELINPLTIDGFTDTRFWHMAEVDSAARGAAVSADSGVTGQSGFWTFQEDTAGQLLTGLISSDGDPYFEISSQSGSNDGYGLFVSSYGVATDLPWIRPSRNTPILEGIFNVNTMATGTNSYYFGVSNLSIIGTTYETEPTVGCYFTASTTQANWFAVCRTSAANATIINTGIASSSAQNSANGNPVYLKMAMDGTSAYFWAKTSSVPFSMVAKISTNVPNSAMTPGIWGGHVTQYINQISGFKIWDLRIYYKLNPSLVY